MFTTELDPAGYLIVDVTGRIDAMAMETGLEAFFATIEGMEDLRILYRVHDLDLPTLGALAVELEHLPALFGVLTRMKKVALVAGQGWVEAAARAEAGIFRTIDFGFFAPEDELAAREWLLQG